MATITQEMVEKSYEIAKKVYNNSLDKNQGAKILNQQYKMNQNSALMYISDIICMLKGQGYKRIMAEDDTKYFLTMIEKEFGSEYIKKSLFAVKQHINYIHSIDKPSNVEKMYNNFMQKYNFSDNEETKFEPCINELESEKEENLVPQVSQNFVYETDLQNSLVRQAEELFPGYKIYGDNLEGIEYPIEGKRIDLLLESKTEDKLLAIELKANVADFKVFGQISMYLSLLETQFPDKKIDGIIIAGEIDNTLKIASRRDKSIKLKSYKMSLELVDE
jgi:hypothetical protein